VNDVVGQALGRNHDHNERQVSAAGGAAEFPGSLVGVFGSALAGDLGAELGVVLVVLEKYLTF